MLFIFVILLTLFNTGNAMNQDIIRHQALAGTFYPADKGELQQMINAFIGEANPNISAIRDIRGIVAPHAGYIFSGATAAYPYKAIQNEKYDLAIIIAPSHQKYFNGVSVYNGDYYETPLGKIKVDKDFAALLPDNQSIVLSDLAHQYPAGNTDKAEHSLEVQLPFLQTVQPNLPIVPIIIGSQDFATNHRLVRAIYEAIKKSNKRVLLIASSDLSHFHNESTAKTLDLSVVNSFDAYDYFKLELNCLAGEWEACGAAPISVLMQVCELLGSDKAVSLHQSTSADTKFIKGDKSRVVGYFGGVVGNEILAEAKHSELLPEFTELDRKNILALARQSVENNINKSSGKDIELGSVFNSEFPAFVTINKRDSSGEYDLRACMGHIIGSQDLKNEIVSTATMAATEDYRFGLILPNELSELKYDVTVLSRFKKILDFNQIQIGKHGIYIRRGRNSGLFLPQVATENHWNLTQYLQNICFKAQLPANAYLDPDAEIYIFEAVIVEE